MTVCISCNPEARFAQELAFATLIGSLRSTSALLGSAKSIDLSPGDLSHLLDLITEKAQEVAELSGFKSP
jgi:hypothetical protein